MSLAKATIGGILIIRPSLLNGSSFARAFIAVQGQNIDQATFGASRHWKNRTNPSELHPTSTRLPAPFRIIAFRIQ